MLAYKTGQYVTNASTAVEDQECIKAIQMAADELKRLERLETSEKNFYHFLGLQGFKRWHRYNAREDLEMAMRLECLLIDHYGIEPEYHEVQFVPCVKRTIIERMQDYNSRLEEVLGNLNEVKTKLVTTNHHFAATFIQECIDELECDLKYAYRHFNFAKDVNGQIKDMHWYSNELHESYKDKERDDQGRDIR